MKKFFAVFFAIVLSLTALTFVACGDEHKHTFSTEWKYDETYHWHEATCSHGGEISNKNYHSLNDSNACLVCGYQGVNPAETAFRALFDKDMFANVTIEITVNQETTINEGTPMAMQADHLLKIDGEVGADKVIEYGFDSYAGNSATPTIEMDYKYIEKDGALFYFSNQTQAVDAAEVQGLKAVYDEMNFADFYESFSDNANVYTLTESVLLPVYPFDSFEVTDATITVEDGKIVSMVLETVATAYSQNMTQVTAGTLSYSFSNYGTTEITE